MIKNICCSSKVGRLDTIAQKSHGSPILGNTIPSSGCVVTRQALGSQIYAQSKHSYTNNKTHFNNLKKNHKLFIGLLS